MHSQKTARRLVMGMAFALSVLAGTPAAHAQLSLESVKKAGKLEVATEALYAPFEFVQDGKIVGYGRDILDQISTDWGIEIDQQDLPFAGILTGLLQKKYDLVATTMIINPERAKTYAFTMPIAISPVALIKRKGDGKVSSVNNFSGLTIGAIVLPSGPTTVVTKYNEELTKEGKGANSIVHFQSAPDMLLALANGQIDAASEGFLMLTEAVKKQPDTFEIVGTVGQPFYIGWAVRPEDTALRNALNDEIKKLRDSGKLTEMQKKWFGYEMKIPDDGYLPAGAK